MRNFWNLFWQSPDERRRKASVNWCRMKPAKEVDDFLGRLPYELTNAQKKVWINRKDLQSDDTMSRLIQGDVGSGKTIIAVWRFWRRLIMDIRSDDGADRGACKTTLPVCL